MNMIEKSEATYVLVINVSEDLKIGVGQLGEVLFKKGDYVYIGSAKGCLETRLQRHLRKEKRIFWHIDYILENQKAKVLQVWVTSKSIECKTADVFEGEYTCEIVKKGFGSSDCKCLSHLFFVKNKKRIESILKEIGFSRKIKSGISDNI
ncbi:MAG: GIY-YIG nuclease family protein [Atribacterota bacterium]|nr:GIY-YIG nuclease family protein [Atribacterota bacterium]